MELTINGEEPIIVPSDLDKKPVFSRIILLILKVFVLIKLALLIFELLIFKTPLILTFPITSKGTCGLVVPIPTKPEL